MKVHGKVFFPEQNIQITFEAPSALKVMSQQNTIGLIFMINENETSANTELRGRISVLAKKVGISKLSSPFYNRSIFKMKCISRIVITDVMQEGRPFILIKYKEIDDDIVPKAIQQRIESKKYVQQLRRMAHKIFQLSQSSQSVIYQKKQQLDEEMSISRFSFLVITLISSFLTNRNKLKILEEQNLQKRISLIAKIMKSFLQNHKLHSSGTRKSFSDLFQKDFSGKKSQMQEKFYKKIKQCKMPQDVEKHAMNELKRLRKTQMSRSSQSSYIENYLEVLTQLPWSIQDQQVKDIKRAKKVLDQDHYGLDKVKKRILQHLAVKQFKGDIKSPTILCFVGPPGVGKTSLGKSIASALGRKFDRLSLGGISDYSFMRGHRRTYVGAMPGQFIQSLRKVKTKNPVILLDEIDKIGTSHNKGDPSSALLEILDPNQNQSFKDHYLEVKFDLSKIMFIATANQLDTIQPALLDRMEIIQLTGYSIKQKLQIAKRYLVPKSLQENGLKKSEVEFNDQILTDLILKYTMETGCRGLNRVIGSVIRGIVYNIVNQNKKKKRQDVKLDFSKIVEYLGPPMFNIESDQTIHRSGVSLGLATNSLGGSLLVIQTAAFPGQGQIHLTGKLGECLKQSVITAISWMRSNIEFIEDIFGPLKLTQFDNNKRKKQDQSKQQVRSSEKIEFQQSSSNISSNLSPSSTAPVVAPPISLNGKEISKLFKNLNIHVHFPSAATPKDGPSAGITILMALISLVTGVPVRNDVAMTGELSLQGQILPIGGVKEKCLAAHRSGISKVLLPVANGLQTVQISDDIKKELQIVLVDKVESAVLQAFSEDQIRKNLIKQVEIHKPRI